MTFRPADTGPARSGLAAALRRALTGEVRFDPGSRALYATDASNYRQPPIGVVIPRSTEDVIAAMELCRRYDAPVLARGGGTSLCGQCCNEAVVLDFSKYLNRVCEIDPHRRTARVQPGVVLDDLRDAAHAHGLTFAPDPATHDHNTLGGMIGNNSCGPHSVMGGKTDDNVVALDILTYDGVRMTVGATHEDALQDLIGRSDRRGEIYRGLEALRSRYANELRERMPDIPRRVSGYNLDRLLPEHGFQLARALVGSEGTCVTVLEATLRLVERPPHRALLVIGYPDVNEAADAVPDVLRHSPIALEGLDERLVQDVRAAALHVDNLLQLPAGAGWLLAEFGGARAEDAVAVARDAMDSIRRQSPRATLRLFREPAQQENIWKIRESGLGATAHVPGKPATWPGWEDSAVPPDRLGDYLRRLRALMRRYGYSGDFYGHFGQGCLHTRIDFDLLSAQGISNYRRFIAEAARLAVDLGGSVSGEHGDGQSKAELLPIMYGERLMQAFREFKALWDPLNRMNPGKVIDAPAADRNLRLGTSFDPPVLSTRFHYAGDGGNFTQAMQRCVGVGACRKKTGTMCPSYMATGEEMHSTRGRARLLFEMLRGDVIGGGWKEPAVKEALDLCLSCKACKGECPVDVDMATYKAEFLSHYYERRLRPMEAYAFGLIDRWARVGSAMPGIANALSQWPPTAAAIKHIVGIAPQRRITRFAARPFAADFRQSPARDGAMDVLLWPDTFNNHFQPEVATAAVRVLESVGCRVRLPRARLCCGRALYEYGMVDRARDYLRRVLDVLEQDIRRGTPIICLEPACASVFRQELTALFPFDLQARRLRGQVLLLGEFLERHAPAFPFEPLRRDALVHLHCHQRAVLGAGPERRVLERLCLEVSQPDSGCCGMAGAFGFGRDKYAVSMRCAERVLLPAVRASSPETLLLADGFSCREQVTQATGRVPLHLAQVLDLSMPHAASSPGSGT